MKNKLTFLFIVFYQISSAQVFTEVIGTPFVAWSNTTLAFADVDGDEDQDILMTGYSAAETMGRMYLNDGSGNYTLVPETPFLGRQESTIDFADIDGDDDLDVLLTGQVPGVGYRTTLYSNNGNGIFIELDTDFMDVTIGAVAFADIDGDADQDVLIAGIEENSNECNTKLYLNNGSGIYTEVLDAPFVNVCFAAIGFADLDGDTDLDVFIKGKVGSNIHAKLYLNDGAGIFNELIQDDIFPTWRGNVSFIDVDADEDLDLITSGLQGTDLFTKLYINDGSGSFLEDSNSNMVNSMGSGHAVADFDEDGDLDLLITGQTSVQIPLTRSTNLYINNGNGILSDVPDISIDDISGNIVSADVNGDNYQDVLIGGLNGLTSSGITKLYKNELSVNTKSPITDRDTGFLIHPNPTTLGNWINIQAFSSYNTTVKVAIFDLLGRNLGSFEQQLQNGDNRFSIDCSKLKRGNYFIQFNDDYRLEIGKLLVQ